jgi:hypothetical protein
MVSRFRVLQLMTVSVPVILVSSSLLAPVDSWLASACAAVKSALTACLRCSTATVSRSDVSLPSETHLWSGARKRSQCQDLPWQYVEPDSAAEPLDPNNAVVIQGTSAVSLLQQPTRLVLCNVRGTWIPTDRQIAQLESDLAHLLAQIKGRARAINFLLPPFERYYRHYGGITLEGGERIIFVNAIFSPTLLPARGQQWAGEADSACVGEKSHYVVEYDHERRRFRGFAYKEAVMSNPRMKLPCAGPRVHLRASRGP